MFTNDRQQLRKAWANAWNKAQQGQPLQPLEQQIVTVIKDHPEYQPQLGQLEADYIPDDGQPNPFLHMGLHLALREQLSTDRPAGILACYQQLCQQTGSAHDAEHDMIECLAEALWQAQSRQTAPDEAAYLACLRQRAGLENT